MAIVQISMRAGRSEESKRRIVEGITDFLVSQGSWRERVVVIINDVPPENYAIGGTTLKEDGSASAAAGPRQ